MTFRTPPRLATVLLERFGPDDDALLGDLREEFRAGRSAVWYWRQILSAIAIDVRQGIGADLRLTGCGVLIGWLVQYLTWLPFMAIGTATDRALSGIAPTWFLDAGLYELWRFPLDVVVYAWIGWCIARLNRDHRIPSLVAFLACKVLLQYPWYLVIAMHEMNVQPRGVFVRYLVVETARLAVVIAAVLIGGTSRMACPHRVT